MTKLIDAKTLATSSRSIWTTSSTTSMGLPASSRDERAPRQTAPSPSRLGAGSPTSSSLAALRADATT